MCKNRLNQFNFLYNELRPYPCFREVMSWIKKKWVHHSRDQHFGVQREFYIPRELSHLKGAFFFSHIKSIIVKASVILRTLWVLLKPADLKLFTDSWLAKKAVETLNETQLNFRFTVRSPYKMWVAGERKRWKIWFLSSAGSNIILEM